MKTGHCLEQAGSFTFAIMGNVQTLNVPETKMNEILLISYIQPYLTQQCEFQCLYACITQLVFYKICMVKARIFFD